MAWKFLNTRLEVNATSMACGDGKIIATVSVSGETDDDRQANHYKATVRDDHVIPDILWDSGQIEVGPGESLNQSFEVELWCNKRCKLVGPAGSSHERTAEIYSHVAGKEREGQSNNISVTCK